MPIEEFRKALMSSKHDWGDAWTTIAIDRPFIPPAQVPADPEQPESTAPDFIEDAMITDMDRVVPLSKPNFFVSSQGWSVRALVDSSDNFYEVPRESAFNPHLQSVITQYDSAGEPLIIGGWHEHPKWLPSFNIDWLQKNGQQSKMLLPFCMPSSFILPLTALSARNIHGGNDKNLPLAEFIAKSRAMPPFATPEGMYFLFLRTKECEGGGGDVNFFA